MNKYLLKYLYINIKKIKQTSYSIRYEILLFWKIEELIKKIIVARHVTLFQPDVKHDRI